MIEMGAHPGGQHSSVRLGSLAFVTRPVSMKSWFFGLLIVAYTLLCVLIFFRWMLPSLDGRSDAHIAADSSTYMLFAQALHEGTVNPYIAASLATFPNNLWMPVLIAYLLKSAGAIVVLNLAILFLSIYLLKKTFVFSGKVFTLLLILNATTTISLLSVNKEVIDLFVISVLFFGYYRRLKSVLMFAVLVAILSRFEVALVLLLFLTLNSRLNPLRKRRGLNLSILLLGLSITIPLFATKILASRFEEASSGGAIILLNFLETHYLYFLAVVPKVAENFFGSVLNPAGLTSLLNSSDVANSWILFLNNLATGILCWILWRKRAVSLRSDIVYMAALGCLLMAAAAVIQPRYFYFVYVLLCLRAAEQWHGRYRTLSSPIQGA